MYLYLYLKHANRRHNQSVSKVVNCELSNTVQELSNSMTISYTVYTNTLVLEFVDIQSCPTSNKWDKSILTFHSSCECKCTQTTSTAALQMRSTQLTFINSTSNYCSMEPRSNCWVTGVECSTCDSGTAVCMSGLPDIPAAPESCRHDFCL